MEQQTNVNSNPPTNPLKKSKLEKIRKECHQNSQSESRLAKEKKKREKKAAVAVVAKFDDEKDQSRVGQPPKKSNGEIQNQNRGSDDTPLTAESHGMIVQKILAMLAERERFKEKARITAAPEPSKVVASNCSGISQIPAELTVRGAQPTLAAPINSAPAPRGVAGGQIPAAAVGKPPIFIDSSPDPDYDNNLLTAVISSTSAMGNFEDFWSEALELNVVKDDFVTNYEKYAQFSRYIESLFR